MLGIMEDPTVRGRLGTGLDILNSALGKESG